MLKIRAGVCAAVVAISLIAVGVAGRASGMTIRAGQRARIASSMKQEFRTNGLNSMVFGVWVNGEPLMTGAFGSALPGVRATKNMHFKIGNTTEAFTTTLLLRLVDQRKVKLNDRVSKWFPQLPRAGQVTLRMLATSTSGYGDYAKTDTATQRFYADPFRPLSAISLIRLGTGLPPVFAPGTSWAFSDTNFELLGAILQKIIHKPLAAALREQILRPSGLTQTRMQTSANIPPPVMHAYTPERGNYEESTFWNPSLFGLNGSMTSSLFDMGRWAVIMGTGSVLSRASHRLQVGPENVGLGKLTPNFYYGMGTAVSKHWILVEPRLFGYSGVVAYFPQKKLAVVAFATIGPQGNLAVHNGIDALLRIARILTPKSVPMLTP
jgi:D-alanyl-D-alanine carboxypeptidase